MADISKAEKIASARKKLKQFQQKTKETNLTSTRSASSSLKSNSPIDILFHVKEQPQLQDNRSVDITNVSEIVPNILAQPVNEYFENCPQQELTSHFSYMNSTDKCSNFFDNVLQKLNQSNQFVPEVEVKVSCNEVMEDSVKLESTNGGHKLSDFSSITSAENKNQIQFSPFEMEELENLRLRNKLTESHNHIITLQHEIKRLNENHSQSIINEVAELEDKIQVHLRTIEILVSEKSELQKELMLLQEVNNETNGKCEEFASRLKASRCQVQKLEKELLDYSENKLQHKNILKHLEDAVQEKDFKIQEFSQKLNDAQNEIMELNKKLELESVNEATLRKELKETEKQLSMTQIKLAQLGSENGMDLVKDFELLKSDLENSRKEAERAWEEGQRAETELKQYITNLSTQVLQANAKCERAERDKDDVMLRVDTLVQHISDLEKQLQHERSLREAMNESELFQNLKELLLDKEQSLTKKDGELEEIKEELEDLKEKLREAEIWKQSVPDMGLLQQAMESDRVAAGRAIEQNNTLKQKLQELEEYIIKINNSKLELTEELDKYRHLAGEYKLHFEKYKSRQEMRMVDSVTQTNYIKKSNAVSQTTYHDIVSISNPHEPVSVETMLMIEGKLKKTMDKIAELSDDKQRLEHLVLQLQSETETIGEYVTLYQNQRSLLKEKAEERERQITLIAKEREELKAKLNEINMLLTHFPHNPEVEGTSCKISRLLGEIQCSSIVQEKSGPPPTFHPCLLCSGKLINV